MILKLQTTHLQKNVRRLEIEVEEDRRVVMRGFNRLYTPLSSQRCQFFVEIMKSDTGKLE